MAWFGQRVSGTHRRRTVGRLLAVLALAAPLAGCGKSAAEIAGEASAANRAWVENICNAHVPLLDVADAPPSDSVLTDPATAHAAFRTYIGTVVDTTDRTIAVLDHVGSSPIPGGDSGVSKIRATLAEQRTSFVDLKTLFDEKPTTPAPGEPSTTTFSQSVVALLYTLDPVPPLILASDEMLRETTAAPACKALEDRYDAHRTLPRPIPTAILQPQPVFTPEPGSLITLEPIPTSSSNG